jgi:hypothetical protein
MTNTMEIYFSDLNEDAQARYLKVAGVSDASELNSETCPLTIVEFDVPTSDVGSDT